MRRAMLDRWRCAALLTALLAAAAGCGGDPAAADDAGATPQLDGGVDAEADGPGLVELRIFHTTDEHGWLEPAVGSTVIAGGAANVMAWWTEQEGFDPARDLLLSGGDSWTGPAISTWFEGEPVVDAMNAMGYAAQAIGNHEFDFGQDVLRARVAQAHFPLLAANLRVTATGEPADYALPYTVVTAAGVAVGVIGLATPTSSTVANPTQVGDLTFDPLYEALQAVVPRARADGAEVVVVLAHEFPAAVETLASILPGQVDAFFAGHTHSLGVAESGGVPVIVSGTAWRAYSVLTLTYDRAARAVVGAQVKQVEVSYPKSLPNPVTPDPAVTAVVDTWRARADDALAEVLGYTATGLPQYSWPQVSWVVDSWRAVLPEADLAILNAGAIRQGVPAGEVTVGDVVSMLPFEDYLYGIEMTGAQVIAEMGAATAGCSTWSGCYPVVSGMSWTGTGSGIQITLAGGAPLDPLATYFVLICDYMYFGGSGYSFADYDPTPVDYGLNYRDPVVTWTRQLGSSSADPLEAHLDATPRAP